MSQALQVIDKTLQESAAKFVSTIAQYQWDLIPDSQLQAAKAALTKSDYIMKTAAAEPDAVHDALIKAAILGLDLTEGKRQGWLLPRRNAQGKTVVQLQVGYKGVEAIHQKMNVIDRLVIRTVRENDSFEWSGDDQEKPVHSADWFAPEESRGPIVGVYSITYFPDGSFQVMTASIEEVYKNHRDRSDSWKTYTRQRAAHESDPKNNKAPFAPPWVTDEKSMIEKTMAYIASKQWPANNRNLEASSKILETLHEIDISDYSTHFTKQQKEAFDGFIEDNDSLGLWLMSRRMDVDSWAALFNTGEKGQKTKLKKRVREMEGQGYEIYKEIEAAIVDADAGRFHENLEGTRPMTAKLVRDQLREDLKTQFDELMNMGEEAKEA